MEKRKSGILSNMLWKFAERISAQLVTLIVSVILARVLDPAHYGTIALVTIFITLANVFESDGFGSALIQKKDADVLDFSSVLYFNIAFSILLYIVLFLCAPAIANFYGEGYEVRTPVTRVLAVRLILSAINSVQQAYVSRKMIFKKFFWSTLFGTIASGIVGIVMACRGFGVWALVAQYLTNTTVDTVVLQIVLNVWPERKFSWKRLKNLVGYGYKVLLTNLIITGYQEIRALIIGKLYSADDLAFYDKAKQFPNLVVVNINTSISAVLFPQMAQEQDDLSRVKEITRASIRYSSYILCPVMLGLAAVADNFIKAVLTEKWLPCVPLLQVFCFFYVFQPIQSANTQAVKALGRSDISLKLEILRDIIQLIVLVIVMRISVAAIVISMAVMSLFFVYLNGYPNVSLLGYTMGEQTSDFAGPFFMSMVMMFIVKQMDNIPLNSFLVLFLQIVFGIILYVLMSTVSHNKEFSGLISILQNLLNKKSRKL